MHAWRALGFVAALLAAGIACDDFSSTTAAPVDAGGPPVDAGSDAAPEATDAPSPPGPFCARLPPFDGGTRFCDDFDQQPMGGTLAGWTEVVADGAGGSYVPGGLSLPQAYRVHIDPNRGANTEYSLSRTLGASQRFRVAFQVRGMPPRAAGVALVTLAFSSPESTAWLVLGGPADKNGAAVRQRRPDGLGGYVDGPETPLVGANGLAGDAWSPGVIEIDGTAVKVTFGGKTVQANLMAAQHGPAPLTVRLGAITPQEAMADPLEIFYDDVVLETVP